ncbi:DUF7674 family protein [Demequina phytophila]|uniref:DUF7674 family protein n=1 Tax=Demequina phytophila TaxID=1638981 RepID=UPI000782835B|nr:hypothetical protein [Demequina phytophila]
MSASTEATINRLIADYIELAPLVDESLEDNEGELLPHLVLADVVRWLAEHVESERDICRSILDWLEREYESGPEDVRGLIAVSGVEMIPDPNQPGSLLREWLGPALRRVDPWLA